MNVKKIIGKWLSAYYDRREESAFQMPFDTEREREAAARYINYNIPYDDCKRMIDFAYHKAEMLENPEDRLFHTYTRFYLSIIDYKSDRFLERVFGLV